MNLWHRLRRLFDKKNPPPSEEEERVYLTNDEIRLECARRAWNAPQGTFITANVDEDGRITFGEGRHE